MTMAGDQHPATKKTAKRKRKPSYFQVLTRAISNYFFPLTKEIASQPEVCTRPTYPSGTPYPPLFQVHADSLHFCAGGAFQAAPLLLHKLIELDSIPDGSPNAKRNIRGTYSNFPPILTIYF
jgi:hypothetical protein